MNIFTRKKRNYFTQNDFQKSKSFLTWIKNIFKNTPSRRNRNLCSRTTQLRIRTDRSLRVAGHFNFWDDGNIVFFSKSDDFLYLFLRIKSAVALAVILLRRIVIMAN